MYIIRIGHFANLQWRECYKYKSALCHSTSNLICECYDVGCDFENERLDVYFRLDIEKRSDVSRKA